MDQDGFQPMWESAKAGDADSLEKLFEVALRMSIASARKRMRPADRTLLESQDLCQSVMVRLYRKLPEVSFHEPSELGAWLAKTVAFVLKEKRRFATRECRDAERSEPLPDESVPDSVRQSILTVISRRDQIERLLARNLVKIL